MYVPDSKLNKVREHETQVVERRYVEVHVHDQCNKEVIVHTDVGQERNDVVHCKRNYKSDDTSGIILKSKQ